MQVTDQMPIPDIAQDDSWWLGSGPVKRACNITSLTDA
jgi:hypothetical protein